ncbi:putative F-box protein At5g55150 [Rosa chinensis]|uniref:putative F-box protein At5g55150 n=1 Tax=Rosa chinensis TaxID=74649 RepID=UPI000D086D25|nr:putative F-box protein At5g55150 [Rosa chinensis]
MDENFVVTLINPLSKVKGRKAKENSVIGLPALNPPKDDRARAQWSRQCDLYVFKATMSADPISNVKDCIVLVIYEGSCQMAFIRLDKDTTWTYIHAGIRNVEDVVYFEDKFYAVDDLNQLWYFSVTTTQFKSRDVDSAVGAVVEDDLIRRYLVELNDHKELVMVKRYMDFEPNRGHLIGRRKTTKFQVFKINADKHEWTEIKTIGDVAIFVGDSVVSVLASDFLGCQADCIYFVHDWDRQRPGYGSRGPRNFGVYNLKTQRFSRIGTAAANLIKMSNRTPIWATANIEL